MGKYIYRYISFETFVGMVQSQVLTFVQPMLWEDPQEIIPFYQFIESRGKGVEKALLQTCFFKTFCQCWTHLSESDAMWRIYSYNKKAVRVKIKKSSVDLLDNVKMADITYQDTPFQPQNTPDDFINALSQKRIAFQHEQEVRLICSYKFSSDEDFFQHIKAVMGISEHKQWKQALDSLFPNSSIEEQVEKAGELLNIGNNRQTVKNISFSHIPDFICGVMIHPQADDWYVKIVENFCNINHVPFEGKSKLYVTPFSTEISK